MSLILFNGPPGCGKDTMAKAIWDKRWTLPGSWRFDRMSMPNKRAFAGTTDSFHKLNAFGHNSEWEPKKDLPDPLLHGKTYRQWQIEFSEDFMKPLYGDDIFPRLFADRNHERLIDPNFHFLVPDLGFEIELRALRTMYPQLKILAVRIYRDGCDFSSDSRGYLEPDLSSLFLIVHNNGTLEELETKALRIAHDWTGASK